MPLDGALLRAAAAAGVSAGEFFRGELEEKEADVPADAWLEDDYRLTGGESIRELTVPMPRYGTAVSILWIVPGSPLDHAAAD